MRIFIKTLPFSRKKNMLVAGIASGALFVVALLLIQNVRTPVPTLTMHKNAGAKPTLYNGVPLIEACNIVSLDELRDKGIELKASQSPSAFMRTYIEDGQGLAPLPDPGAIPGTPNNCHYDLQGDKDWFDITVYQPSYSSLKKLEAELAEKYSPQPDIGNLKVFKAKTFRSIDKDFFNSVYTNKDNEDFILTQGDTALWFRLRDFKQSTREEVLHLIAANFSGLLQKPEARVTMDYKQSPVRGKLYKACELLTSENAVSLLGQSVSPVVEEGYATSLGTRNFEMSPWRLDGHLYATQVCSRSSLVLRPHNRMTLQSSQYITEKEAKDYIQSIKNGTSGKRQHWQAMQPSLGDEAYAHSDYDSKYFNGPVDGTAYVRKGAMILAFSYHLGNSNPSTSTEQLRLVITNVLERIK